MISQVSFNGTFTVSAKPGIRARFFGAYLKKDILQERQFRKFNEFADSINKNNSDVIVMRDFKEDNRAKFFHRGKISISVPDSFDEHIASYLDCNGIKYKYTKNPD